MGPYTRSYRTSHPHSLNFSLRRRPPPMELEAPPQKQQQPQATTMSKVDYKSMLIQHAAKSHLQLPQYQTVNQGPLHAPQFKAVVTLDGETFESSTVFKNRKEAEQDASRVALEGIAEGLKTRGVLLVRNDTVFCKSILHEYAMKMKKEKPTYTSEVVKGILPLFITSVTFDGNTYTGSQGKNKKEAEQIGARVAIESILGSGTGTTMSEIIKSKGRLYDAIPKGNGSIFVQDVGLTGHVDNHNIDSVAQAKERESAMAKDKLPNAPTCDSSDSQLVNTSAVELVNTLAANPTPSEAKKPKEELCELARINDSGTSQVNLQQSDMTVAADESAGIGCSNSRKRQSKRKKSHAKRARANGQKKGNPAHEAPSIMGYCRGSSMFPEPAVQGTPVAQEAS